LWLALKDLSSQTIREMVRSEAPHLATGIMDLGVWESIGTQLSKLISVINSTISTIAGKKPHHASVQLLVT
jgi:hypothetical protein